MPYVKFLAAIGETNRPPGGIQTVRRIALNCFLRPSLKVLDIGCNTGFVGIQLARLTGCTVIGLDIDEHMVKSARNAASEANISDLVHFLVADTRDLPFEESSFDVVICGGSLAFIKEQYEVVNEWIRVVRPWGMIADAEFFYHSMSEKTLRHRVSEAIGVPIPNWGIEHWRNIYRRNDLELFFEHQETVKTVQSEDIQRYGEAMAAKIASSWSAEARAVVKSRLIELMELSNENLKHMSSALFIFRCIPPDAEPALFS